MVLIVQLGQATSKSIVCEKNEDISGKSTVNSLKDCIMKFSTTIASPEIYILPKDSSVKILNFNNNKNISFLPVKVDETFPNLVEYQASSCSLKSVSKINFKNLRKVKELHLGANQIEIISSDTFDDLISMKRLGLGLYYELLLD